MMSMKSTFHDPLTTISKDRINLQWFQIILNRTVQNYQKSLKKYFLGSTYSSNHQSHNNLLPVGKGLIRFIHLISESDMCSRQCCGPSRGFVIHITDNNQQVINI